MGNETTQPPINIEKLYGTQIDDYELKEILKNCSTGNIYVAHDTKNDRDVSFKIFSTAKATDEERQRFVRAMQSAIPLKQENIVRIYKAGIKSGYCWIAMQYVDGESLAVVIDRVGIKGMLPWQQVWKIAIDITLALKAAGEHDIIHRNVTPTNILQRSSDKVCLLNDFAVAKPLSGKFALSVTVAGELIGEVPYMAPERTRLNGTIDTRSDIYGLGATLYALLTGRPPATGNSQNELIKNIRSGEQDSTRKYQLAVDEDFDEIVMKMIAKPLEDRFQTPIELLDELYRLGKNHNISY